jgi:hypothetical protein
LLDHIPISLLCGKQLFSAQLNGGAETRGEGRLRETLFNQDFRIVARVAFVVRLANARIAKLRPEIP